MNDESAPDAGASVATADRAAVEGVLDQVGAVVATVDRTERLPVGTAIGRPLADPVTARRALPHYDRARVDGLAVAAAETTGASAENAVRFAHGSAESDAERVEAGAVAVPVDAGDELPGGADAVVPAAAVESDRLDLRSVSDPGDGVSVTRAVVPGAGVRPEGGEFERGETVFPVGRRLRPADPALCVSVGRTRVEAVQRPAVGIVPTGDGLVGGDPAAGEAVETNGRTLSALVERWGGKVTYRDAVATDPHALRAAVERDLTKDLLVTTGGTGAGSGDRIYDILADLGEVHARGVALAPGQGAGFAVVRERPVVVLPGDPVGCLVAATTLLGPAVSRLAGRGPVETPTTSGRLAAAVESERGVQTVVPVAVEAGPDGCAETDATVRPLATPATVTRATVARADGWVTVPADAERRAAGETVTVAAPESPL